MNESATAVKGCELHLTPKTNLKNSRQHTSQGTKNDGKKPLKYTDTQFVLDTTGPTETSVMASTHFSRTTWTLQRVVKDKKTIIERVFFFYL